MKQGLVAIVLVNYNSASFLIECLESIYRMDYPSFQVIVVDNSAENQEKEIEALRGWLKKNSNNEVQSHSRFSALFTREIQKPELVILEERERFQEHDFPESALVLIKSRENDGFAGGCNKALEYIAAQKKFEFVWLLNTDTFVMPEALRTLVEKIKENENLIAVSSKLLYYDLPTTINLIGGKFYSSLWRFGFVPIGYLEVDQGQYDKEIQIDTPAMASCLFRMSYLEDVGYMREDYFLYSEDVEWFERMRRKGYEFAYQYKSVVYHRESAITQQIKKQSLYYYVRNKVHFYLNYYPRVTYKIGLGISLLRDIWGNLRRGYFSHLFVIFQAIRDGIQGKLGKI